MAMNEQELIEWVSENYRLKPETVKIRREGNEIFASGEAIVPISYLVWEFKVERQWTGENS